MLKLYSDFLLWRVKKYISHITIWEALNDAKIYVFQKINHYIDINNIDILNESQPKDFKIDKVYCYNWLNQDKNQNNNKTDLTLKFLRLWNANNYTQTLFKLKDFMIDQSQDSIIEIQYQYNEAKWRILYDISLINDSIEKSITNEIIHNTSIIYPPYCIEKDKIPEFQFFMKDIEQAQLFPNRWQEDVDWAEQNITDSEIEDVSELMLSLRGPGSELFYADTEVCLDLNSIAKWIKMIKGKNDFKLVITWTDETMQVL